MANSQSLKGLEWAQMKKSLWICIGGFLDTRLVAGDNIELAMA